MTRGPTFENHCSTQFVMLHITLCDNRSTQKGIRRSSIVWSTPFAYIRRGRYRLHNASIMQLTKMQHRSKAIIVRWLKQMHAASLWGRNQNFATWFRKLRTVKYSYEMNPCIFKFLFIMEVLGFSSWNVNFWPTVRLLGAILCSLHSYYCRLSLS